MNADTVTGRRPGWWYPYIFVGLFLVVLAVNGTMAYFATSTFTGLETKDAYLKGLAYNQNIAMAKAQEQMGWTVQTKIVPASDASGAKMNVSIRYLDRDGKPVEGLDVHAMIERPTTTGYDHSITLAPLGQGAYGGVYALPFNGVWDMEIAALGDGVAYQHKKRILLP